tara:strand:- start:146 stop:367 length:222 start_codon:yes stop_codon:yes gene_type:complete
MKGRAVSTFGTAPKNRKNQEFLYLDLYSLSQKGTNGWPKTKKFSSAINFSSLLKIGIVSAALSVQARISRASP